MRIHWITLVYLLLLIFAALTAQASALTITSTDTVEISTKDATGWEKLEAGDVASVELTHPQPLRFTVTGAGDEKLDPVIQVIPGADLILQADYSGKTVDVVQTASGKIEGYYAYGKSSSYPWGMYWCLYTGGKEPFLVYSEFSTRSVWTNYVSQDNYVKIFTGPIQDGKLPDINQIQQVVGR